VNFTVVGAHSGFGGERHRLGSALFTDELRANELVAAVVLDDDVMGSTIEVLPDDLVLGACL
jgi:hypothetical protein